MATKILLKKSSTAGSAPLTGDLDQGELAINLADRKIFTKNNSGAIVALQGAYVDSVAPSTPAEGDLWYDTGLNTLKAYNGSAWNPVSSTVTLGDLGITATATELNYTDGVTSNIQTQLNGKAASVHTHSTADITTGTFADARIAQSNVTQHEAALSITESQISDLKSYSLSTHNHTLDSLSNVTIVGNTNGEILKWNGSAWVNNTLAEAGIQPAGAYLTAESDTLQSVTTRGAISSAAISLTNNTASTNTTSGALVVTGGVGVGGNLNVGGNTIITGDLTVNGTTTTVNSNEVNIGDSIIVLNVDETGTPSQNSGIEIERGTSANVSFVWNEADDAWDLNDQTLQNVVIDGGAY